MPRDYITPTPLEIVDVSWWRAFWADCRETAIRRYAEGKAAGFTNPDQRRYALHAGRQLRGLRDAS